MPSLAWENLPFFHRCSLQGGRAAHFGETAGVGSGEGPSQGQVPRHKIKIFNHHTDQELDVEVPEDRWLILCPKAWSCCIIEPVRVLSQLSPVRISMNKKACASCARCGWPAQIESCQQASFGSWQVHLGRGRGTRPASSLGMSNGLLHHLCCQSAAGRSFPTTGVILVYLERSSLVFSAPCLVLIRWSEHTTHMLIFSCTLASSLKDWVS